MLQVINDPSFIHQVTGLQKELDSYNEMESGIIEIIDEDFLNSHEQPTQPQ